MPAATLTSDKNCRSYAIYQQVKAQPAFPLHRPLMARVIQVADPPLIHPPTQWNT